MPRLGARLGWRASRTPGSETTRFHVFHVVARVCVHAVQHQCPSGSDQAVYVEGVILIRLAQDRQPAANRYYCHNFLGRRSLGARQREARRECSRRKCRPGARFHQRLLAISFTVSGKRLCVSASTKMRRVSSFNCFDSYSTILFVSRSRSAPAGLLLTKRRSNATLDWSRRRGIILEHGH